ncbi:SseB family protein [Curtobacterium sp. RRHDQ10]|uniref:SseB family protein n=1 Tax=Curtobacterium phyllosphaerae TaxID=3413379 RepID=UPI003BF11E6C
MTAQEGPDPHGPADERPDPHGHGHDSAGLPWAGRTFQAHDTTFAGDDGSADPALLAAIRAVRSGSGSHAAVLDAVRPARLLVPLVAHAGDVGATEDGRLVDKTQELSIVTVAGPDGRRVMPAFTSVDAMRAWDPGARPVPVESRRVAMAAASEGTEVVVLDPTSPTEFVLRRPAVWALGQDRSWTPCFEDPRVGEAIADAVADEPAVVRVELAPGDPQSRFAGPELTVGLVLVPGLTEDEVLGLLGRLQRSWGTDPRVAERVDSLGIALRPAG